MEKRKLFIGCSLPENGIEHCKKITSYLADTYGISDLFERFEPHMTWKAPFYATDAEYIDLCDYLTKFCKGRNAFTVQLGHFGHFKRTVLYADIVSLTDELELLHRELCDGLKRFPWMTFEPTDTDDKVFHVSVSNHEAGQRFATISNDVREKFKQYFLIPIDTLQVFEKTGDRWLPSASFRLEIIQPKPAT